MAFSAIGHRPSKHKPPADDRYFSGEARGQENPKVNDWPIFKCALAVLLAILLALLVAIRQQNTPRPQAITLHDLLARQKLIQNPLAFPTNQGDISKVIVRSTDYSDAGTNSNDVPSFNPKGQLPVEQTQLGKVIWSTKLENNAIFEVRVPSCVFHQDLIFKLIVLSVRLFSAITRVLTVHLFWMRTSLLP